jgi:hypothetical protein
VEVPAEPPEGRGQLRLAPGLEVGAGRDPGGTQAPGRGRADAVEALDGQGGDERQRPLGRITARPSGLRRSEASFARNLLNETPAEAVSPPVASLTSALIRRATSTAGDGPVSGSVTSR